MGPYTRKWSPWAGFGGKTHALSTGAGKGREHWVWRCQIKQAFSSPATARKLTTGWGRSAPGAVAQADGGAEAPQLEARITAKRDARPGVMEHALCGSVHRHWRPEASHH